MVVVQSWVQSDHSELHHIHIAVKYFFNPLYCWSRIVIFNVTQVFSRFSVYRISFMLTTFGNAVEMAGENNSICRKNIFISKMTYTYV